MKRLTDIDFQKTYGEPPESFQRRVAYALRQTEEEKPVKKFTLRTAILVAIMVLALGAVAYAAITSQTADIFGWFYGAEKKDELMTGDIAPTRQSTQLGDVVYTLEDIVYKNGDIYGSGFIKPAEGASIVLIAEDYSVDEPAGAMLHYGEDEQIPDDYKSYADLAKELGARIVLGKCVPNAEINGTAVQSDIGYSTLPQPDGSLQYMFEIVGGNIERADSYELSLHIANWEITPEGEWLREEPNNTWLKQDWLVSATPSALGDEPVLNVTPEPTATPAPDGSELRVLDGWMGNEKYRSTYPDRKLAELEVSYDDNGTRDLKGYLLSHPDDWDVAVISSNKVDLASLVGAGLAADLSGDAALMARVDAMFPAIQAYVERDPALYGIPLGVMGNVPSLSFCYDADVRKQLGYADGYEPDTFAELAAAAEQYMALDRSARKGTIFYENGMYESSRLGILRYLLEQYSAQYADENGIASFDTPVFRDALASVDKTAVLDTEDKPNYTSDGRLSSVIYTHGGGLMGVDQCYPMLGDKRVVAAQMRLVVINPHTPRMAEALAYAACAVEANRTEETAMLATYDYDALARETYDRMIEEQRAQGESEEWIQTLIAERDSGEYRYFESKEVLADYAATTAPYLDFKLRKWFDTEPAMKRYVDGETDADGLIAELDKASQEAAGK